MHARTRTHTHTHTHTRTHTHTQTHIEEVSQVRLPKSKWNVANMESLWLAFWPWSSERPTGTIPHSCRLRRRVRDPWTWCDSCWWGATTRAPHRLTKISARVILLLSLGSITSRRWLLRWGGTPCARQSSRGHMTRWWWWWLVVTYRIIRCHGWIHCAGGRCRILSGGRWRNNAVVCCGGTRSVNVLLRGVVCPSCYRVLVMHSGGVRLRVRVTRSPVITSLNWIEYMCVCINTCQVYMYVSHKNNFFKGIAPRYKGYF